MKNKTLSIVIPAYNEGPTIYKILDKIKAVSLINAIEKEIVIVNDCSSDSTAESIQNYMQSNPKLKIIFVEHIKNKGKGAALHTGIKEAKAPKIES